MDPIEAQKWADTFENKSIFELETLEPVDGLPGHYVKRWQRARLAAIEARKAALNAAPQPATQQIAARADQLSPPPAENAAEDAVAEMLEAPEPLAVCEAVADPVSAPQATAPEPQFNSEQTVEALRERIAAARERLAAPPPMLSLGGVKPLTLPSGDAAQLLEYQLATSAALIGHLAGYITRDDTMPDVCVSFMDRMSALIGRSAQVGKVVGQLRGHVSRSKQEISVSHAEGGRGRGERIRDFK